MQSITVLLSAGIVVLALLLPGFDIIRVLFAIPLWVSFFIVVIVTVTIATAITSDKRTPTALSSHHQRFGLHHLTFTSPSAWSAVLTRQSWEESLSPGDFPSLHSSTTPELDTRLDRIFAHIRSSFILPWYARISPSPAFPNAVEALVRQTLSEVVGRAETVDWSALMVSRLLPLITDHVHHFRTIEHLSSTSSAPIETSTLPLPLPAKSHPALSQQAHVSVNAPLSLVEAHFRTLLGQLFAELLPESERSEVVMTMVREVVLGSVLMPVFDMLSDSDFWNRQIDERGGRYLHEQKQVNKFLSALSTLPHSSSKGTDSKTNSPLRSRTLPPPTSITASSSTRQFEAFLRSIPKVKTIGETRRLRADIEREQRFAKSALDRQIRLQQSSKEYDVALKRAKKYMKRLDRARIEVDARIAVLTRHTGVNSATPAKTAKSAEGLPVPLNSATTINLYAVLSDPSSLAYWLEYMERRGRSLLVQFWLTVEGFKDPLEGIGSSSLTGSLFSSNENAAGTDDKTAMEDLSFLYATYFSNPDPILNIPAKHVQTVSNLIVTPGSSDGIRRAKQAVFASQQAVYDQMIEEDWGGFQKGELFLKAVADLTSVGSNRAQVPNSPEIAEPQPAMPMPVHRRQHTAPPLPLRRTSAPMSPKAQPLPSIFGRQINPATTASPSAFLSMSPPVFDRRSTDIRPSISRQFSWEPSSATASSPTTPPTAPRQSSQLDFLIGESGPERGKLFSDDEDDEEALHEDDEDLVQLQRMEAIQTALNEIIASDDLATSRSLSSARKTPDPDSSRSLSSSLILDRKSSDSREPLAKMASRSVEDLRSNMTKRSSFSTPQSWVPSDRSRKLSHRSSIDELSKKPNKHLFNEDNIREESHQSDEDNTRDLEGLLQMAIPADIELSVEIARLQEKIQELVKQEHLLENLIRRAELTGNESELKLLHRSQTSLRREQRTVIFQKAQYERQEEENRLVPGRTQVSVPSSVITTEDGDNGKQVVRYTVEVKQPSEDGVPPTGWMVARRYNEFWELDKALKEWSNSTGVSFPSVHELPPKKLVPNMSASFVDTRRQGLERYLQSLLLSQRLCESHLLRSFLSRSGVVMGHGASSGHTTALTSLAPHNIVKSLYKTMATSLDDSLLGPSMLDMMSSTLSRQIIDFGGYVGLSTDELAGLGSSFLPQALKSGWNRELTDPASSTPVASHIQPMGGESGMGSFTAPICDVFIEVFDLKENNWLRRQAIVIILQQFLGGTIERKVRDTLRSTMSPESFERILAGIQEAMWPDGIRRAPSEPRTDAEKLETKQRASRKLGLLIPDIAANMIGRGNARRAARRVFGALQDKRLNQHLILCIIDEIIGALLPPNDKKRLTSSESRCYAKPVILYEVLHGIIHHLPVRRCHKQPEMNNTIDFDTSVSAFNQWLGANNYQKWSLIRLNDAQKESLLWVGICAIIAACFWKGIPRNSRVATVFVKDEYGLYVKVNKVRQTKKVVMMKWIPILAPIKYHTVLYHECCHAIVGFCTGGRPVCIAIDWNEGGSTMFAKEKPPNPTFTLPAGYIGSCVIGCSFLFCGFDTVASKYAFVAFECMALASIVVCLLILPKSFLLYWRHKIAHYWYKCTGDMGRAKSKEDDHAEHEERYRKSSRWKSKKQADAVSSDKEQMVSIEMIILTDFIIGGIVAVAWLLYDSLYLRFVISFLGTINTLYAIWDVYLDGIKYGKVVSSDCTEMARQFNKLRRKQGKRGLKVVDYARIWLSIEISLFIITIIVALYVCTDTIAQQALRSRNSILATSFHYTPANILQDAQDTASGWFDSGI